MGNSAQVARGLFVIGVVAAGQLILGQVPRSTPRFEVASVKPSLGDFMPRGPRSFSKVTITDTRVIISGVPLKQLIQTAYDVKPYQIVGPSWMDSVKFDILATIPAGAGKEQVPAMLQTLLAGRFQLTLHRSTSDRPVYGLMVSKTGLRLNPSDPSAAFGQDAGHVELADGQRDFSGMAVTSETPFGPMKMFTANGVLHYEYSQMTLTGLAQFLSVGQGLLGLPVVDMMGVEGRYQVTLDISGTDMLAMNPPQGGVAPPTGTALPATSDPPGSSLLTSLEKLGLRLERTKTPMEQLVIDHAEKIPTGN